MPHPPSPPPPLARAVRGALALAVLVSGVALARASAAGAAPAARSVDVVKVQGIIDPAEAAYVRATIQDAERDGATVILQKSKRIRIDAPDTGTWGRTWDG